jgi:hypothetical protein
MGVQHFPMEVRTTTTRRKLKVLPTRPSTAVVVAIERAG